MRSLGQHSLPFRAQSLCQHPCQKGFKTLTRTILPAFSPHSYLLPGVHRGGPNANLNKSLYTFLLFFFFFLQLTDVFFSQVVSKSNRHHVHWTEIANEYSLTILYLDVWLSSGTMLTQTFSSPFKKKRPEQSEDLLYKKQSWLLQPHFLNNYILPHTNPKH